MTRLALNRIRRVTKTSTSGRSPKSAFPLRTRSAPSAWKDHSTRARLPCALVGGTGKYLGATGQLFERFIGTNTTKYPNTDDAGPNFRFDFDLRVLD